MSVAVQEALASGANAPPQPEAGLRVGRLRDPTLALGAAVEALMGAPAFASQPFGAWSRVLIGQVNRGHYALARRAGTTVGFVGYARVAHETAERWLHAGVPLGSRDCQGGPVILINAWTARDRPASLALRQWLRAACPDAETVVARRLYPDNCAKVVRLPLPHARRTTRPADPFHDRREGDHR